MKASELLKQLNGLLAENAANVDPVKFAYIQSLANKLRSSRLSENAELTLKLQKSLADFSEFYTAQKKRAEADLAEIELRFSDHIDSAKKMFDQSEFASLSKLLNRLRSRNQSDSTLDLLKNLTKLMDQSNEIERAHTQAQGLEQILSMQEMEIYEPSNVSSSNDSSELDAGLKPPLINDSEQITELQSMAFFRQATKHINIDKLIERAITVHPENPGPHNPHMLAIKSLTKMRALSPQYIRRFAAYIETLLWLEKNATKLAEKKNK